MTIDPHWQSRHFKVAPRPAVPGRRPLVTALRAGAGLVALAGAGAVGWWLAERQGWIAWLRAEPAPGDTGTAALVSPAAPPPATQPSSGDAALGDRGPDVARAPAADGVAASTPARAHAELASRARSLEQAVRQFANDRQAKARLILSQWDKLWQVRERGVIAAYEQAVRSARGASDPEVRLRNLIADCRTASARVAAEARAIRELEARWIRASAELAQVAGQLGDTAPAPPAAWGAPALPRLRLCDGSVVVDGIDGSRPAAPALQ